ncbi:MAG: hypothetical protein IH888_12910, partial [Planctomycetes bacterium]|nr:hypothetical protein [Planctomycetota bacterium]
MTKRGTTRWAVAAAAAVWMAALIVCPAWGQATEQDARRALNEAARLPPAEACGRIEDLLGQPLSGRDRRACLQRLRHLLPEAPTPLNAKENQLVTEARESNDRITQMLVGRHVIVLGTDRFARRARDNNLVTQLDLSCAALKALFGNDPVRRAGHRYIIYPRRGKRSGYTTNSPTLRVWIGQAQQDDADRIEALVHELSHPFIHDHPARHIFAGGFTEGWADFAKAYVSDQLGFLGPPFRGRFAWWASDFRKAGRVEYLDTRLPIEEIIAYRPSSSLLVELVLAGSVSGGPGRWEPYRRLFHDAVEHPAPKLPGRYWPAHMAYDYRRYFDEDKVLPILRRYRFPVDRASQQEVQRLLTGEVAGDQEEAARVMTGWKVLGPLPDADGVKLRLDPIDAENFRFRDVYQVEGRAYRWREVPVDGAGVVRLGD